jgi:hypothetical protein
MILVVGCPAGEHDNAACATSGQTALLSCQCLYCHQFLGTPQTSLNASIVLEDTISILLLQQCGCKQFWAQQRSATCRRAHSTCVGAARTRRSCTLADHESCSSASARQQSAGILSKLSATQQQPAARFSSCCSSSRVAVRASLDDVSSDITAAAAGAGDDDAWNLCGWEEGPSVVSDPT